MSWGRRGCAVLALGALLVTGCGITMDAHPAFSTSTIPLFVAGREVDPGAAPITVAPIDTSSGVPGLPQGPTATLPGTQADPNDPTAVAGDPSAGLPSMTQPASTIPGGIGAGSADDPFYGLLPYTTTTLPDFPIDNRTRLLCESARTIGLIGLAIAKGPILTTTQIGDEYRTITSMVRSMIDVAPPTLANQVQAFLERNRARLQLLDLGLVEQFSASAKELVEHDNGELIQILGEIAVICPASYGLAPPSNADMFTPGVTSG